jgi:hypothetical protein
MAKRRKQPGHRQIDKKARDDVLAFLIENGMERVLGYLQEGRRFEALDGADLRSEWIAAFKVIAGNPVDPEFRKRFADLQDEMELRRIEPPYDEVKKELDAFVDHATQLYERLKADPERLAEVNQELQADIDAVKAKRDTFKKN